MLQMACISQNTRALVVTVVIISVTESFVQKFMPCVQITACRPEISYTRKSISSPDDGSYGMALMAFHDRMMAGELKRQPKWVELGRYG